MLAVLFVVPKLDFISLVGWCVMCCICLHVMSNTYTRLTAILLGLPRCADARKVKPIWILLKQKTVSGSGISWAICKSAPRSRQITTAAPHHSVSYRPDALPAAQWDDWKCRTRKWRTTSQGIAGSGKCRTGKWQTMLISAYVFLLTFLTDDIQGGF